MRMLRNSHLLDELTRRLDPPLDTTLGRIGRRDHRVVSVADRGGLGFIDRAHVSGS